jgi:SAM-dependent methyltransferase
MRRNAQGPAEPDRGAALQQYRRRAPLYDLELALFEPLRRRAVARLALRPGEIVLDLGCGTGLSLPLLRAGVGPRGQVIGVEQSPEMAARARQRAAGWRNVQLHGTPVEAAPPMPAADAALLHFTHDVLQQPDAVARIGAALKPGARVVACGLKWAPRWRWPLNGLVAIAARHSVTAWSGLDAPWALLAERLGPCEIEPVLGGAAYLAWWPPPDPPPGAEAAGRAAQGTSTAAPSKRPARRSASAWFASRSA